MASTAANKIALHFTGLRIISWMWDTKLKEYYLYETDIGWE